MSRHFNKFAALIAVFTLMIVLGACSQFGTGGAINAPTTGDTANDAAAAGQYVPNIPGFIQLDTTDIVSALTSVGAPISLITGNPVSAALLSQIQGMMDCYSNVGAVASRVYAQTDIASIVEGQIPVAGVVAVINTDRVANNFLPCALGSGRGMRAEASQPCGGSGSFPAANGENITYLYAATSQDLCNIFLGSFPRQ